MNREPEASTPTAVERRSDIKAEYEAEFEVDAIERVEPEQMIAELRGLMGPSTRAQVTKLSVAFRQRMRDADREISEMQERESALQASNRALQAHNKRLSDERDEWRGKLDPQGEVAAMREELAKALARAEGAEKLVEQHVARIEQLKSAKLPKKARGKRK